MNPRSTAPMMCMPLGMRSTASPRSRRIVPSLFTSHQTPGAVARIAATRPGSGRISIGRVDTRFCREVHASSDDPFWSAMATCPAASGTRVGAARPGRTCRADRRRRSRSVRPRGARAPPAAPGPRSRCGRRSRPEPPPSSPSSVPSSGRGGRDGSSPRWSPTRPDRPPRPRPRSSAVDPPAAARDRIAHRHAAILDRRIRRSIGSRSIGSGSGGLPSSPRIDCNVRRHQARCHSRSASRPAPTSSGRRRARSAVAVAAGQRAS